MEEIAAFIMASRWRAMAVAAVCALIGDYFLPLIIVSAAVIALVTLRRGLWEGLLVLAGAGVLTWLGFMWLPPRPGFPFPLAFALWLPLLPVALVLRNTFSQGYALLTLWGLMVAYVGLTHALTGDVVAFWKHWLTLAVANVKGATVYGFEREGTLRLLNGLVAMLYTLCLFAALALARWWQALLYHPGGFGEEFYHLRLPRWLLPLAIALVWGAGYLDQVLMVDLLLVGLAVYTIQGLAILHCLLDLQNASGLWMILVYGALLFLPQYAFIGVALLGAMDSLIDLRGWAAQSLDE